MTPAPIPRARRILGRLLAAGLAGLGGLTTLLGAGLSLIGLCCSAPAPAAAGAGVATTTAGAAADGPATWPFLTAGAALFTAAWLLHRRTARQGCRPSPGQPQPERPAAKDHPGW